MFSLDCPGCMGPYPCNTCDEYSFVGNTVKEAAAEQHCRGCRCKEIAELNSLKLRLERLQDEQMVTAQVPFCEPCRMSHPVDWHN